VRHSYGKKKLMGIRDFSKFSCSQTSIRKSERAIQIKGFMFPKETEGWLEKVTKRYDV